MVAGSSPTLPMLATIKCRVNVSIRSLERVLHAVGVLLRGWSMMMPGVRSFRAGPQRTAASRRASPRREHEGSEERRLIPLAPFAPFVRPSLVRRRMMHSRVAPTPTAKRPGQSPLCSLGRGGASWLSSLDRLIAGKPGILAAFENLLGRDGTIGQRLPQPALNLRGLGLGCPVCAHFVHYTSRRNRVPPRRGFRVEVQ